MLRRGGNMDAHLTTAEAISDPGRFTPLAIVALNPARDRLALDCHFAALRIEDLHYRFVLPAFRRKGFAKALLRRSARYARTQGLSTLVIHSLGDNTPMLSLARRIGR